MKAKFLWKSGHFSIQYRGVPFWCSLRVVTRTCCVVLLLLTVSLAYAAKVEDFMPQESVLFLKLQDIDEVYAEIETSESWEKALALLSNTSDWQEMQQGILMVPGFLGTDLLSIIQTIGYRTGLTVWSNTDDAPQIGLVIHSGGNLSELQRFTKIVEGLIGMSDTNTLHINAGEYQRVRYNMMKVNQQYAAKYGFVDEFLVLGVGDGAFEKLMDTFRKKAPSIAKNTHYAKISENLGSGQVLLFCDVQQTLKVFPIDKEKEEADNLAQFAAVLDQLKPFEVMFGELNLLETGEFLKLHAQFTQKAIERFDASFSISERLMKEKNPLETLKAVSGKEDLFIAISPLVSASIWQAISQYIAEEASDDVYAGISFFEGLLNLNLEDDIFPSLTGEIAMSVHDLSQFDPSALDSLEIEFDGAFTLDASGIETQGILIFNSRNPLKWNQLRNSVSNLQNISVSQSDYKGVTVSTFATNLHYSTVDGLFLFGSSEEQMYVLIDEIKNRKRPTYLKHVPERPIAIAQLNLARALEMEKGAPPFDRILVNSREISPLLAWISVKNDEVLLEANLSRKGTGLEALARLMPFIVWNMEQQ